jgi:hypothetical protein
VSHQVGASEGCGRGKACPCGLVRVAGMGLDTFPASLPKECPAHDDDRCSCMSHASHVRKSVDGSANLQKRVARLRFCVAPNRRSRSRNVLRGSDPVLPKSGVTAGRHRSAVNIGRDCPPTRRRLHVTTSAPMLVRCSQSMTPPPKRSAAHSMRAANWPPSSSSASVSRASPTWHWRGSRSASSPHGSRCHLRQLRERPDHGGDAGVDLETAVGWSAPTSPRSGGPPAGGRTPWMRISSGLAIPS